MRRCAVVFGLLCGATAASANPFFIGRYQGLRGDPVDQSAFSIFWNPAGLATEGGKMHLHLMYVNRQATYDRVAEWNGEAEDSAAANAGLNHTGAAGLAPALGGAWGTTLGDFTLGLGAAFYVARAGATNWRPAYDAPAEHPGAIDGPNRWATINTSMLIYSPSAAVAVGHGPTGLSLGVAPVYNIATLDTVKARTPDGTTRLVDDRGQLAEGRILLEDGSGEELTWVIGLRWDVSDDLAFGLAWHTEADLRLSGDAYITFGTAEETVERSIFNLPVAQTIHGGARVALSDTVALRPSVMWHQWSVMDRQIAINVRNGEQLMDLARDFDDTWHVILRADWQVDPVVTLHGGLGYETAATPPRTFEPGLAESTSYEFAAGLTLDLNENLSLSSSFFWQQFEDVTVRDSVQKPTTNGTYTDARQYLTLDVEVRL